MNANKASYVDHVCNANDLSRFDDGTFEAIYASHIIEHLDYKDELALTLKDWCRVIEPGGKIYISVPDLDVLAELILSKNTSTIDDRFLVMRMLFGGHGDKYDYHMVGLNREFLTNFLESTGFINIKRVEGFDLFDDTSNMKFKGTAISLNLIAEKSTQAIPDTNIDSTPKKVGRNEPCPCGSGKKYKKCHGLTN